MLDTPVLLHIDELALVGFTAGEGQRIHDALQHALVDLLAGGALTLPERGGSLRLDSLAAQTVNLPSPRSTNRLAEGVARAIVGGIGAASAASSRGERP